MDHKEFGQLIKALREQVRVPFGGMPTQEAFAELCGIAPRTFGRIERGEKINLTHSLLVKIAQGLQLTPSQQQLFTTLPFIQSSPPHESPNVVRERMLQAARHVRLPAIVYDNLFRIAGVNSRWLGLHNVDSGFFDSKTWKYTRTSLLRLICESKSPFLDVVKKKNAVALQKAAIEAFRVQSLPHFHTDILQCMLHELSRLPNFIAAWQQAELIETVKFPVEFRYFHSTFGEIAYTTTTTHERLKNDLLILAVLLPQDEPTAQIFDELGCGNDGLIRF